MTSEWVRCEAAPLFSMLGDPRPGPVVDGRARQAARRAQPAGAGHGEELAVGGVAVAGPPGS